MDKLLDKIRDKSKYRQCARNVILLEEGEIAKSLLFIKKGIIRHAFSDINGNDITKNFIIGPAYFFHSLSSFITQTPSMIYCETLSDVELYEMKHEDFKTLLKEDHEFQDLWNRLLSRYIIKKEIKELSMMKDSALKRYEMFLNDYPGLLNQIPHYYIAAYLSVTPETLSRIRKEIS